MNMSKKLLAGALAGAVCLSLVGCGKNAAPSGATGETSTAEGQAIYRKLYSSELTTINYLTTTNQTEYAIGANVVDCLVEYNNYGEIIPSLAESWSHNEDMTEWTFNIRKGVKWVDTKGKEVADVTANDWVSTAHYVNDANNNSGNQYMYNTGAVVKNAQAYYNYTAYMLESDGGTISTGEDGKPIEAVDPVDAASIGVTAKDDYTLVYTLDQPCPFFLSVLSYTSYMPAYGPFLEEMGVQFGMDNESLLYNGAFILSKFEPQDEHVLTKNPTYWDKDNVFIDEIQEKYNPEANSVEATMYKNGEIDLAHVSADLLNSWLADDATKDLVHASRPDNSFSYFYTFNFDPNFDAEYEPENWTKAVNNENFRQAVMHALDRVKAKTVDEPYNPQSLISNTITPQGFAMGAGLDYVEYPALKAITDGDSFDVAAAATYRDKAKEELTAAGATFPIKVLMPYNPTTPNWDKECQVVEQQLESALGADFVDVIVQAGPESGFLSSVRRSGNYAFMKCNYGADYADPQTWSEPFAEGNNYNFWDTSADSATAALFADWKTQTEKASAIYDDDAARYTAYSEAEAMLIDHAIVIPYSISSSDGYIACNINPLEGEYAPYGVAIQRYKYQHLYDTTMNMDEFQKAYEEWQTERAKVVAATAASSTGETATAEDAT